MCEGTPISMLQPISLEALCLGCMFLLIFTNSKLCFQQLLHVSPNLPPVFWSILFGISPKSPEVRELEHMEPAALAARWCTQLKMEYGLVRGDRIFIRRAWPYWASLHSSPPTYLPCSLNTLESLNNPCFNFVLFLELLPSTYWTKPVAHQHILLNKLLETLCLKICFSCNLNKLFVTARVPPVSVGGREQYRGLFFLIQVTLCHLHSIP